LTLKLLGCLPGLLLLGAGQGLCLTPLTATVLSQASPDTAGSVSGALSTAQQVGNAIGVAVTGVVFYGLAGPGMRIAFSWSVAQMGALLLAVAALTITLPRREPRPQPGPAPSQSSAEG
jgi:predicted MFS family arabinose efflux permease